MGDWMTFWHGRKWDAPFSDDSQPMPDDLAQAMLGGLVACTLCSETLLVEDDVFLTPSMAVHLECYLRVGMGDVAHLEGRCICCGNGEGRLADEDDLTYRQEAKATLQWLLDNNRGRWEQA